jgi:hypothetical protein
MARDPTRRPRQAPEDAAAARGERAGKETSEIFSRRLGLRLTPQGHLVCEAADGAPDMDEAAAARLGEAFARGSGQGLLRLGAGEVGQALPPIFVWWRGVAARYVAALTGPLGLIHRRSDAPVPVFDAADDRRFYPAFHVVAGLTEGLGRPLLAVTASDSRKVAALAWRGAEGLVLWAANLTREPVSVALDGLPDSERSQAILDLGAFDDAARHADAMHMLSRPPAGASLRLGAYSVARIAVTQTR